MILALHIFVAISTVIVSLLSAILPKQTRITMAKYAVLATVTSGIIVALTSSVSFKHLCVSGTVVVSVCAGLIYYGNRKLVFAKQS